MVLKLLGYFCWVFVAGCQKLRQLLSFAIGGLLGDVFLHLLPEAWALSCSSGTLQFYQCDSFCFQLHRSVNIYCGRESHIRISLTEANFIVAIIHTFPVTRVIYKLPLFLTPHTWYMWG